MKALSLCAALLLASGLHAQPLHPQALAVAKQPPDLTLPQEAKSLSIFSPLAMAIYKPEGDGPFPAVVLVHTCGGLGKEIREWTKRVLERNYVAFVMDSYGQRGMVGLAVSGGGMARQLGERRFKAVVSFYPSCYFPPRPNYRGFEFLRRDTDEPLLVLMGEADTETPVADCLPRLESLKQKGAPVEWHVYPDTTHCWDCFSLHNFSKTDFRGSQVVYRYDEKVTEDSVKRTFEFLARNLASP